VHFLDAWTSIGPLEALRQLLPALLLFLAVFLPGRRVARATALGVALGVLGSREIGSGPLIGSWFVLWVVVAVCVGASREEEWGTAAPRPGGIESGMVGLALGLVLMALLIVAVGRQNLSPDDTRRGSLGLLLLGCGLLHLLVRRDAVRGALGFATLGLGLQVLERAARDAALPEVDASSWRVVLATAIAVALTVRVAAVRQRDAGSAWVSDAHDLHD
jgi:hypothetical protein